MPKAWVVLALLTVSPTATAAPAAAPAATPAATRPPTAGPIEHHARILRSEPGERILRIQTALAAAGLDGWLFQDFRGSDPLAYRILGFAASEAITTRRWSYFIPKSGEPRKLVHAIERGRLDRLPGSRAVYLGWSERQRLLREMLGGARKVAMQYSPMNDIPTLARVDAGTVELVRSFGVEVVSAGELVAAFESVWSDAQLASHREAAALLRRYVHEVFAEVGAALRAERPITERDVQLSLLARLRQGGMVEDPPIVAVGANAANPHYEPSAERFSPIRRNDLLLIDISSKLASGERPVYADITWMAWCGRSADIPAEVQAVWSTVREARDRAFAAVRSAFHDGREVGGADIDDVARGVIRTAGHGEHFLHRTGHSIGEEVHGSGVNIDNLESRDSRRLRRRTAFSIEPGIYLEGRFGVRSEIDVWVGEEAVEATGGEPQRELVVLLD